MTSPHCSNTSIMICSVPFSGSPPTNTVLHPGGLSLVAGGGRSEESKREKADQVSFGFVSTCSFHPPTSPARRRYLPGSLQTYPSYAAFNFTEQSPLALLRCSPRISTFTSLFANKRSREPEALQTLSPAQQRLPELLSQNTSSATASKLYHRRCYTTRTA